MLAATMTTEAVGAEAAALLARFAAADVAI